MKKITYLCDKCGTDIGDVYYTLSCYAEAVHDDPMTIAKDVIQQNMAQSMASMKEERHLCKACKDAITDGIFIV